MAFLATSFRFCLRDIHLETEHLPFSLQCFNYKSKSVHSNVLNYHVNFAGILLVCSQLSLEMAILIVRPNTVF